MDQCTMDISCGFGILVVCNISEELVAFAVLRRVGLNVSIGLRERLSLEGSRRNSQSQFNLDAARTLPLPLPLPLAPARLDAMERIDQSASRVDHLPLGYTAAPLAAAKNGFSTVAPGPALSHRTLSHCRRTVRVPQRLFRSRTSTRALRAVTATKARKQ